MGHGLNNQGIEFDWRQKAGNFAVFRSFDTGLGPRTLLSRGCRVIFTGSNAIGARN
jgi:hypothetical protein